MKLALSVLGKFGLTGSDPRAAINSSNSVARSGITFAFDLLAFDLPPCCICATIKKEKEKERVNPHHNNNNNMSTHIRNCMDHQSTSPLVISHLFEQPRDGSALEQERE